MPVLALKAWSVKADPDFQHAAATRLPLPVVCGQVLFAVGGFLSWVMYLITDKKIDRSEVSDGFCSLPRMCAQRRELIAVGPGAGHRYTRCC